MKLDQLIYVIEIARSGSISKAAKKLLMTQPNLSTAIKSLEDELGFEIFDRNNTGITITQKGQELLKYADNIQSNIEMINYIKNSNNLTDYKELQISSDLHTIAFDEFINVHNSYKTSKTRFNFKHTNYYQVIQDIHSKEFNIGCISISDDHMNFFDSLFKSKCLKFTPVTTGKVNLYVLDKHPLYHRDKINHDDLHNSTLVFCNLVDPYCIYNKLDLVQKLNHIKNVIHVSDPASIISTMVKENAASLLINFDNVDLKKFYDIGFDYKYFDINAPKIIYGWLCRQDYELTPVESEFINNLTTTFHIEKKQPSTILY